MSKLKQALNSGKFVVTSEIGPPKGTNIEKMLHHIDLLKDKVDALNVTDHQSSVMRFPSIGGCLAIKEQGGEKNTEYESSRLQKNPLKKGGEKKWQIVIKNTRKRT